MDFYTPLFSKIVDSSLWSEPDHVVKMFVTMLALKDQDFVVRWTAFALGKKCWPQDLAEGVAERRAMDALKILSEPDTSRIEPQPFDGRRIERVMDGYKILNGEHYRDVMRKINARNGNSERQKRFREKQGKKGQPGVSGAYKGREGRFERALERDEQKEADAIAAEGIKSINNVAVVQEQKNTVPAGKTLSGDPGSTPGGNTTINTKPKPPWAK
jgi:hypothetical protein